MGPDKRGRARERVGHLAVSRGPRHREGRIWVLVSGPAGWVIWLSVARSFRCQSVGVGRFLGRGWARIAHVLPAAGCAGGRALTFGSAVTSRHTASTSAWRYQPADGEHTGPRLHAEDGGAAGWSDDASNRCEVGARSPVALIQAGEDGDRDETIGGFDFHSVRALFNLAGVCIRAFDVARNTEGADS